MIMRYGEKGKCWSNYLDYCLRNKTISFSDSQLSRTKQKKILSKVREIIKERLSRDYASEPMTPAPADRNVFSNADEFPPLPQAAGAPQAPPPATLTKDPPPTRAIPTYNKAAQAPPTTRPPPQQREALPQPTGGNPPAKRQPPQQHSTATPPSPTIQWPAQRKNPQEIQLRPQSKNPQEIQLRPQRVVASGGGGGSGQQLKQVPRSAQQQQRQLPSSPKSAQQPVAAARSEAWQSRPVGGHPRALGQMPQQQQQPRSSIAQQPRSPVGHQPRSPVGQQPRSPVAQQPRSPIAQHARPPGNRQPHVRAQPQFTHQPHPQAVNGRANGRLSRKPEAPMLGGRGVNGRKPANKPSKLSLASHTTWADQLPELPPGAIQSPAEFPPLGAPATAAGKRQPQHVQPHQGKRRERPQIPSNSIRDLSTRQTKRTEEMTFIEGTCK